MAKKFITYKYLIIILIVLFCSSLLHARINVSSTNADITARGLVRIEKLITDMLDLNGQALANSIAIVNITGYPVGSAILEGMPHFLLGFTISSSFANMHFFDPQKDKEVNLIPVGSMNPVIFFGAGLKKGFDIMFKLMGYHHFLYKPPLNYSFVSLKGMALFSGGVKMRYNIQKKISVFPGIFNFGGVTVGLSVDAIHGFTNVGGRLNITYTSVEVANPLIPTLMDISYDSTYSVDVTYTTVTTTPEVKVHLNLFLIFDVYTGFGIPISWGEMNVDVNSYGPASSSSHVPTPDMGTMYTSGGEKYAPFYVMPVWIGGIEMNIYILRFTFATCVNLYNRSDINAQVGVRTQW